MPDPKTKEKDFESKIVNFQNFFFGLTENFTFIQKYILISWKMGVQWLIFSKLNWVFLRGCNVAKITYGNYGIFNTIFVGWI